LTWKPKDGTWTVVVMNADASRGVDARVDVGVHVNYLWWIVGGLLGAVVALWIETTAISAVLGLVFGALIFGYCSARWGDEAWEILSHMVRMK